MKIAMGCHQAKYCIKDIFLTTNETPLELKLELELDMYDKNDIKVSLIESHF